MLEALGAASPVYAHLPLLHGPDGRKLSKRHGADSVQELRDAGYLPEAVDNYIALLGAGFARRRGVLHAAQLADRFRLERVSRARPCSTREAAEPRRRPPAGADVDELTTALETFTVAPGLRGAVEISREKIQTLADFWPLVSFLFDGPVDDPAAFDRVIGSDGGADRLRDARAALAAVEPFDADTVQRALRGVVEERGVKPGKVFQPVRVRLPARRSRPESLSRSRCWGGPTLARIDAAIAAGRRRPPPDVMFDVWARCVIAAKPSGPICRYTGYDSSGANAAVFPSTE